MPGVRSVRVSFGRYADFGAGVGPMPNVEGGVGALCPEGTWGDEERLGTWAGWDQLQADQGGEGYAARAGVDGGDS